MDGVLLLAHWNAAWLTGGVRTRIDVSREAGAGAFLITREGRRVVLASNIEAPRLAAALDGLPFEFAEHEWTAERADAALVSRRAVAIAGGPVVTDLPHPDCAAVESSLARLRVRLEDAERRRYRAVAADAGRVVGDAMRSLRPGTSEIEAASAVGAALTGAGMTPLVLLAGGDGRTARFRHPVPSGARWHDQLMVGVCAERYGLVVALSRTILIRPLDTAAQRRWDAATEVFRVLLGASTDGTSATRAFELAREAYGAGGFPGEETRHHQGGAIAYRSREWVAHPASSDRVTVPQALAWNPTVGDAKIEDTCLAGDDGLELVTLSPGWPVRPVAVNGRTLLVSEPLLLTASSASSETNGCGCRR